VLYGTVNNVVNLSILDVLRDGSKNLIQEKILKLKKKKRIMKKKRFKET
jgi:hypothetical protein